MESNLTPTLPLVDRLRRFEELARDDRLTQGASTLRRDGKEVLGFLSALYGTEDIDECPDDPIPSWLKHLLVTFFQSLALAERQQQSSEAYRIVHQTLEAAVIMEGVDFWPALERQFKLLCVERAIAIAEPLSRDWEFWPRVTEAASAVREAITTGTGYSRARSDAYWAQLLVAQRGGPVIAYVAAEVAEAAASLAPDSAAEATEFVFETEWAREERAAYPDDETQALRDALRAQTIRELAYAFVSIL